MNEILDKVPRILKDSSAEMNSNILKVYPKIELISVFGSLPFIKVHSLHIGGDPEHGFQIRSRLSFENPTILSADLEDLQFGLMLEHSVVANVSIRKILLHGNTKAGIEDVQLDCTIKVNLKQSAIEQFISKITSGNYKSIDAGLVGPLKIGNLPGMESATKYLILWFPLQGKFAYTTS